MFKAVISYLSANKAFVLIFKDRVQTGVIKCSVNHNLLGCSHCHLSRSAAMKYHYHITTAHGLLGKELLITAQKVVCLGLKLILPGLQLVICTIS